ncbi:hypothetical protein KX816_18420 [Sphingosinicellaceae bacterium]|nr:hypothetical protein KX816_18420 [Sphingosinicellaceae bacterium]
MRDAGSCTIPFLALTIAVLVAGLGTKAVAGPAAGEVLIGSNLAGHQIGADTTGGRADRRPEGMTATPYELETYDTTVASKLLVQGDPATFELYGFKLGMSVREADRNARRLHLRFNGGDFTSPSFDGRVAVRAAALLGRPIPKVPRVLSRTSMADAEGNHYLLEFLPMEAGASVSSITYSGSRQGESPSEFLAALQAKYGKPTSKYAGVDNLEARWCSNGDLVALCDARPALGATGSDRVDIVLVLGSRASHELDHRVDTKAAEVAGAERRPPAF